MLSEDTAAIVIIVKFQYIHGMNTKNSRFVTWYIIALVQDTINNMNGVCMCLYVWATTSARTIVTEPANRFPCRYGAKHGQLLRVSQKYRSWAYILKCMLHQCAYISEKPNHRTRQAQCCFIPSNQCLPTYQQDI